MFSLQRENSLNNIFDLNRVLSTESLSIDGMTEEYILMSINGVRHQFYPKNQDSQKTLNNYINSFYTAGLKHAFLYLCMACIVKTVNSGDQV